MRPDELPRAPAGTVTPPPTGTDTGPRALAALAGMGTCYWSATLVAGAVAFLVIGVPTALVDTPVFGREIAPRWWDYVVLAASSLLIGMIWAARSPRPDVTDTTDVDATGATDAVGSTSDPTGLADEPARRRSVVAGAVAYLAVGCPVCNKLVLLVLGSSGALTWFAPVQPVLGAAAVALLAVTLRRRLRGSGPLACAA